MRSTSDSAASIIAPALDLADVIILGCEDLLFGQKMIYKDSGFPVIDCLEHKTAKIFWLPQVPCFIFTCATFQCCKLLLGWFLSLLWQTQEKPSNPPQHPLQIVNKQYVCQKSFVFQY